MGKGITLMYSRRGEYTHRNIVLGLISVAFLLGGILGYWVEGKFPADVYVKFFIEYIDINGFQLSVWQEIRNVLRWPAGLYILCLLPFTGVTIPILICLRGFLLSYSISAFVQESTLTAMLLFGPTCVLTLPVLFLMSTEGLLCKAGEQSVRKPVLILACVLALCLCLLIESRVIPNLLR